MAAIFIHISGPHTYQRKHDKDLYSRLLSVCFRGGAPEVVSCVLLHHGQPPPEVELLRLLAVGETTAQHRRHEPIL